MEQPHGPEMRKHKKGITSQTNLIVSGQEMPLDCTKKNQTKKKIEVDGKYILMH